LESPPVGLRSSPSASQIPAPLDMRFFTRLLYYYSFDFSKGNGIQIARHPNRECPALEETQLKFSLYFTFDKL
jgi:hypothetical protein